MLRSEFSISVDVYEKLPVPYGLVRFGVAPDHYKLKEVTKVFKRIAQMEGFRFLGNVCVGTDIGIDELSACYHAVIFANGAEREKDLGIPGEHLQGSHSAREFVAWYNGHPHYRDQHFDFTHRTAVIIGQGNVALDIARMLVKSQGELKNTDIADYAFEALSKSKIEEVHVIGRRGPMQASFTTKELREFDELGGCTPTALEREIVLNDVSALELETSEDPCVKNNYNYIQKYSKNSRAPNRRECCFRFGHSPLRINGRGSVSSLVLQKNRLKGQAFAQIAVPSKMQSVIDCGLVFRCIGSQADPISGLPYDDQSGVLSNVAGRVTADGRVMAGVYVTGWGKRGSTGTIGTNRGDSVETVDALLADLHLLKNPIYSADYLSKKLHSAGQVIVDFDSWEEIDKEEVLRGIAKQKPCQKITRISDMLALITAQSSVGSRQTPT